MTSTEFQNHPVTQKLEQLATRLQEKEATEKIEATRLDFYKSSCDYIQDRLKHTIPTLIQSAELDTTSKEIEGALNQINTFLGNNNQGHLENATNNLYTAISRIRTLPFPFADSDFNFSKSISSFQQTVSEKLEAINSQKQNSENQIKEIEEKIKQKDTEIKKLSDLLTEKEKQVQTLNTNFQTEFNNIKTNATKQFDDERATLKKEITADRTKIQTDTTELLKELETNREKARTLVGVIGNVGATGNYQNIANAHRTAANFWRYVAIGFMGILSFLLVYTIWRLGDPTFHWEKALLRIVSAAVLVYPATYAAKESSKHRQLENYNRKAELELASIDPFIALIDNTKRQAIKERLVDKYFGNHADFDKEDKEQQNNIGLLDRFTDQIVKVIKNINNK